MPLPSRIYASDEELGKRDDDYRLPPSQSWSSRLRWRRKRILLGLAGLFCLWLFLHNTTADLGSIDIDGRVGRAVAGTGFDYRPPSYKGSSGRNDKSRDEPSSTTAPTGPPPRNQEASIEDDHYYSGPIKFYNLAASLRTNSARARGHGMGTNYNNNRNVVFAASSLRSASNLIPMACEMSRWRRNSVHVMLLGRESLPLEELLIMNGVDQTSCVISVHDGRPDYSEYSSDLRAEVSVAGALNHANTVLHFQVIITDDSAVEDVFFTKGVRTKATQWGTPVIEIPKGKYEDFLWMTRLDCSSLTSWHKPNINILIHAPPHSSGSLLRTLESVKEADYDGLVPPQLTIDLPADVEPFARNHIRDTTWPPVPEHGTGVPHRNDIKLHHRLSTTKATTESNTMRLLEAFYPANPEHSHVLLLSSQAELSPLFYHYLLFNILEYRYSASAPYNSGHMLGIALSSPQTYLNGSAPFTAPSISDMNARNRGNQEADDATVPFLWQAPNADAALIFGDRWTEFHDYIKNRLRVMHSHESVYKAPVKRTKLISDEQPGWMEYMLELMIVRGWSMLYPGAREGGIWATVHRELYQLPDDFVKQPENKGKEQTEDQDDTNLPDPEEPFLSGDFVAPANYPKEQRNVAQHSQPLHAILPFDGDLAALLTLPSLSHNGDLAALYVIQNQADKHKEILREQVGGCSTWQAGIVRGAVESGRTDDLFCFVDMDLDESPGADVVDGDAAEPASRPLPAVVSPKQPPTQEDEEEAAATRKGKKQGDEESRLAAPASANSNPKVKVETEADAEAEAAVVPSERKTPPMKPIVEDLGPPPAAAAAAAAGKTEKDM